MHAAIHDSRHTPATLPIESNTELEHIVQTLEVQILLKAAELPGPITVGVIRQAIQETLRDCADRSATTEQPKKKLGLPEPQAFLWLENRLDELRGCISKIAHEVAREARLPAVTPDVVRACWQSFSANRVLMQSVLDKI